MPKMLLTLAALAVAAPVGAQTTQPAAAPAAGQGAAPSAEQKMVKKRVCKYVQDEAVIGSRLGSKTDKVCTTVLVPADPQGAQTSRQPQTAGAAR